MKVSRIEAEGMFSFGVGDERLVLELGERLTAVVGPNASGKSNISRVLDLVQTAVRFEDANQADRGALATILDEHVRSGRHEGMPSTHRSTLKIGFRLTSEWEVSFVTAYVRSLVLLGMLGQQMPNESQIPALETWIAEMVTPAELADLFDGTVVVSHSGIPGSLWAVGYEFLHLGTSYTWHIQTAIPNLRGVVAPSTRTGADVLLTRIDSMRDRLWKADGGVQPNDMRLEAPPTPFSFAYLLPDGSDDSLVNLELGALSAAVAPAPYRDFIALAGFPSPQGDPTSAYRRSYNLAAVLHRILDRGLWYLDTGGLLSPDQHVAGSVARRLHDLKNGSQPAQGRYRDMQRLFTRLAPGHRFEVRSEVRANEASVQLDVEVEVFPEGRASPPAFPRPLRFAGTGVEQALIIAETLVGDPDRLLLLDEPATNLHPPWQRIVRSNLCSRDGQVLLVTHSPYLIPSESREQLATIVRFDRRNGATRSHRLTSEDLLDDRWVGTMIKELGWSADARGLLFAAGVVLVEGETELAALPAWFAKSPSASHHRGPDDLHIAFFSVGGDQYFHAFIAYLERFGVPWAVVCDGAAFRFDRGRHIFERVVEAGVDDTELLAYVKTEIAGKSQGDLDEPTFARMVAVGRDHGVFTMAGGWHTKNEPTGDKESFEAWISAKPDLRALFASATAESPRSKPRAGRVLAETVPCPPEIDTLYGLVLDRLWNKGMTRYPDL